MGRVFKLEEPNLKTYIGGFYHQLDGYDNEIIKLET